MLPVPRFSCDCLFESLARGGGGGGCRVRCTFLLATVFLLLFPTTLTILRGVS